MKKIKLLFKMVLLGLFLIGCVFRSQERVCAAEMEVECVLHKVEICNICWHDFNSELCPHTKGVIYGGNECKTYDEKYCGLCGAKIGECEHEEGKSYGGVECEPWEKCNICGNNYFDPNGACSHWKGNRYGGTVCEYKTVKTCNLCGQSECEHEVGKIYGGEECTTTDKMMCSVCNDWYRDCCHIVGREYKNIVYYFYMDSRREYVRNDVIDLENIRDNENNPYNSRNKIYAVVKIKTDTQDEFDKAWNSLGMYDEKDCNIYSLIMNMHGTPTEIFSDVGSSPMRMSIQDVEKLKTKPVQRLVLLQCSVGKIEKAGENIASAFARSVTGKVLAGDGVVNQNEVKLNKKENNTGDDFCKEGQNIFVRYYVDDEGWYIYKHDWNERNVKYTYVAPSGKMYRLYQLINMLDI